MFEEAGQPGGSCGKPGGALPGPFTLHDQSPKGDPLEGQLFGSDSSRACPDESAAIRAPARGGTLLPKPSSRPTCTPAVSLPPFARTHFAETTPKPSVPGVWQSSIAC